MESGYSLYLLNEDLPYLEDKHDLCIHNVITSPEELKGLPLSCKRLVLVELPKFKRIQSAPNQLATLWLRFLTFVDGKRDVIVPEELYTEDKVSSAVKCLRDMHLNEKEYRSYDRYWDDVLYERSISSDSKYAEGVNVFYFVGKAIGYKTEIYRIASRLLDQGMDIGLIMRATHLTKEEVSSIEESKKDQ